MSWFRVKLALGFQLGAANRLLSAAEEGRALDVAQVCRFLHLLPQYTSIFIITRQLTQNITHHLSYTNRSFPPALISLPTLASESPTPLYTEQLLLATLKYAVQS